MTKRGRWAQHPELLLERSRNGVVRASDLESLEMSSRTIYTRCLPGGPWQRLLPGIILLHNNEPTAGQLVTAGLLHGGADAVLTGTEACLRHGLRRASMPPDTGLHLLIPHDRKIRSTGFVTMERTIRLPSPVVRDGVPLAPLIRATTDAVRRLGDAEQVEAILIESVQNGGCHPKSLLHELDHGSLRGTAVPRRLLTGWVDLRSMAESRAKMLGQRLPAPPSHWNAAIYDRQGRYIGRPDALWVDVGLVWEIDSFEFHFRKADYARTVDRNTRYAAAGLVVVQTLPSRLRDDPDGVLADLTAAHRMAASRPRPDIHLTSAA
ncbi:hypothetical protein GCM10027598_13140 [Amycolatopsis oliviviridis]|uniref:DUF559 domain-containing protein n=1 Tax=Amycolatopsis oliviviridis TaxID=1471590 RepID=A0ABQ3LU34_9PSEU|nr:hypothetical protein [Amycolatopsis oliviviridis]GHH26158.1 hypothetical protein GCM10017790_53000 [Amycolatopsis oliviviridis]